MGKFYLVKILIFLLFLILIIGFVFFPKDEYKTKPLDEKLPTQKKEIYEEKIKKQISEEDKIKTIAETFVSIYYSYTWGKFSNIESQYDYMTDEMKNREENKVKKMREEIENQPPKYFSTKAEIISSELTKYQENIKAIVKIQSKIKEINGAFVTNIEVPEISPSTSAMIDSNKNIFTGDIENLILNTIDKSVEITLLKVKENWRVSEIR